MGQTRVFRTNVDASPNQMATNTDTTGSYTMDLMEFGITNPNSSAVYVSFYTTTSGTTTVGTTTPVYGPILIPASDAHVRMRAQTRSFPLASFGAAITVAATTTATGNTSPTSDVLVEIQYIV